MKILTTGVTRTVLLTRRFAFKIPNFRYGVWKHVLWGLLANLQERAFGTTGWPEFCPVVFADRFGLLVVMRRAEPLGRALTIEEYEAFAYNPERSYYVPVENKDDSFGTIDGRLVAVDYGS